ncbi:hypothetical protein D3C86_1252920 [compost metagenome]
MLILGHIMTSGFPSTYIVASKLEKDSYLYPNMLESKIIESISCSNLSVGKLNLIVKPEIVNSYIISLFYILFIIDVNSSITSFLLFVFIKVVSQTQFFKTLY